MVFSPRFLDCTFRDGGYYNDWDFSPEVVGVVSEGVLESGVSVLEMGFRFMSQGRFSARTRIPPMISLQVFPCLGRAIAVMVNAKEMLAYAGVRGGRRPAISSARNPRGAGAGCRSLHGVAVEPALLPHVSGAWLRRRSELMQAAGKPKSN